MSKRETRFSLRNVHMNRNAILNGNTRQYISVTDMEMLEQISELLPFYKSFNMLANDALRLGLPKLINEKKGAEISTNSKIETVLPTTQMQAVVDERIEEIIRLLSECAVNSTITKFIACSLFNVKCRELNGESLRAKNLQSGELRATPAYMEDYELEMLQSIDEGN
jgi:hypothetical protein